MAQHQLTERERIEALEKAVQKLAGDILNKEELKEVVRDTMKEVLLTAGKGTKAVLITLATIIGALLVIGGGLKWILGAIGFHYIK